MNTKASAPAPPSPLPADELRRACDPGALRFASTADLEPIDGLIGQSRALSALAFGTSMAHDGYNIYALGSARSGRHRAISRSLEVSARDQPLPDDWVYVNNFETPGRPRAIRLAPGTGARFRDGMAELVDDLSSAIPAMFESEDYRNRRKSIDDDFEAAQEKAFEALAQKAKAQDIAILRTPMGYALAPMSEGQVIKPEVFHALPEDRREAIEERIAGLQDELEQVLRAMPQLEKERRQKIRKLNADLAALVVGLSIKEIAERFETQQEIRAYLEEARSDLIDNVELFLRPQQEQEESGFDNGSRLLLKHPLMARYTVNLLVSHFGDGDGARRPGAPVISEEHPTLANIFGRIDHRNMMGTLVTDFTLVKAGALHRANGGYLVLDVRRVLMEPFVWEGLKRCLRKRRIEIISPTQELGLATAEGLEPDPIPLSVKLVLIGDRELYHLLATYDPEFNDLFKVMADFDDEMPREAESEGQMARLLGTMARNEKLRHMKPEAVARLVEEAARDAADAERLSLRVGVLADIVREADYWAGRNGSALIGEEDVARAIDERRRRNERIREKALESIRRNIMLVDTDGETVGQVNGLSVISLGELSFGRPSRITARVRMGSGKVVDIEREVELGGPIHSKGVLILSSYLASNYALSMPMSLWASLVFEQSYGGVEGDSASSAELYALLSALAGAPVRQCFAVTGSVNQFGHIQPIGGVNEKIEGFFDVCAARGLTGRQGVLIPEANRVHLMLRPDVVAAARDGRFHIHAVSTVSEGIALLTGVPAGERGSDGRYPEGTINGRVEARLEAFATARRAFGRMVEPTDKAGHG